MLIEVCSDHVDDTCTTQRPWFVFFRKLIKEFKKGTERDSSTNSVTAVLSHSFTAASDRKLFLKADQNDHYNSFQ